MGGRHLDDAGAELGIDELIGDDRDRAAGQRQPHLEAQEILVALVVGVDRHRRVAQHRLGPGRGDDHVLRPVVHDRVA